MTSFDYVVVALFALALVRGLFRGLLREVFSIGALALAVVVVRLFNADVAHWLLVNNEGDLSPQASTGLAGLLLVVGTIGAMSLVGKVTKHGAKAAGLGWADRAGGAVIGAAEGVLVAAVAVAVATHVMGEEHEMLVASQSVKALEDLDYFVQNGEPPPDFEMPDLRLPYIELPDLPEVAAPPPEAYEGIEELASPDANLDLDSLGS
jgi:membrane protein required for colicin V production